MNHYREGDLKESNYKKSKTNELIEKNMTTNSEENSNKNSENNEKKDKFVSCLEAYELSKQDIRSNNSSLKDFDIVDNDSIEEHKKKHSNKNTDIKLVITGINDKIEPPSHAPPERKSSRHSTLHQPTTFVRMDTTKERRNSDTPLFSKNIRLNILCSEHNSPTKLITKSGSNSPKKSEYTITIKNTSNENDEKFSQCDAREKSKNNSSKKSKLIRRSIRKS